MIDKNKESLNNHNEELSKWEKDEDDLNQSHINWDQKSMSSALEVQSKFHSSSLCDLKSMVCNKIKSKNSKSFIEINWDKKLHK